MFLGEGRSSRVEPFSPGAVGLVRDRRAEHPVADLLAVDFHLELGFESRDPLALLAGDLAQVPLAGEAPELADVPAAVDGGAETVRALDRGQVGVALVDLLELERLFQAREVTVVLLVEFGDEAVGPVAVGVQLGGGRRRRRHRS